MCKPNSESNQSIEERILNISEMPVKNDGDEEFWNLVKQGEKIIDSLIVLIDNEKITSAHVYLFGGYYTVGDIAVMTLLKITPDLPLISMFSDTSGNHYKTIGFGVYWQYVREKSENRIALKEKIREWYNLHSQLHWVKEKGSRAGGYYCVDTPGETCVKASETTSEL